MNKTSRQVQAACHDAFTILEQVVANYQATITIRETGIVQSVKPGIARVAGLPGVQADELVCFPRAGVGSGELPLLGIAFNLDPEEVGVILLGDSKHLQAGDEVYRTGRVMDVPVGEALLGRVVNVMGHPLDDRGALAITERRPVEREAPAILDRAPVTVPLQTGLKVVDALIPIGRGQRELIVGDRQTGKTAIALDTILNQKDQDVICIYCAIGQRSATVARVIAALREYGALDYTIVVVASGQDSPGLQYITPYGATTIAEYFMEQGRDVLIVYDDLTHHARSYRELSLLLRRPPGREAYPGDIFYLHSRLLERATRLSAEKGGGSLTALPIIETQAQNISAYIPTNLISITDGQIYLSPDLFQKSIFPAVDVGKSVSRVGGKTQLPAYRAVAGELRLSYAQFQEVEVFARFGTQIDEQTRQILERGRRVREVLKQPQSQPLSATEQIAVLLAVTNGLLDPIPLDQLDVAEQLIRQALTPQLDDLCANSNSFSDRERAILLNTVSQALTSLQSNNANS
ncbi:F0F1 ATP synthase subunit alpha [Fischerella thermalis CCMEE 5319]|nr:F0F1 ATP synthase subunit alpha [Fischerella thermalis CCMEE 5319]